MGDRPAPRKRKQDEKRTVGDIILRKNWTKYDLAEVETTTSSGNTQAALSFLSDLKKRKESPQVKPEEEKMDCETSAPLGHVFFAPECVVGQKKSGTRRLDRPM